MCKRTWVGVGLGVALAAWTALAPVPGGATAPALPPSVPAITAMIDRGAAGAKRDPVATVCAGKRRQGCRVATYATDKWQVPAFVPEVEPAPTETLEQALEAAYTSAPELQAERYRLRASDEDYALALAELRPSTALEISGDYTRTVPGRTTQATRPFAPSPIITANSLTAHVTVDQPLSTGGRASADRAIALAQVRGGREGLRSGEGDVLLGVITASADVRRDEDVLRLRAANLHQLAATLDEVRARREAGELTRTDVAQAETQLTLAQTLYNTAEQQREVDRAAFAALVGHAPGVIAPLPALPALPATIEAVFALADEANPDLGQAIEAEHASRARIAAARAAGRPQLSLRGSAELTGQAAPFALVNEDQRFIGRAVLTIPLTNGGRVGAAVAQARDRNAADREGIEFARRKVVETIVDAWNGVGTGQRNIMVGEAQVASARVFDEGTFEEYRAGLRSTFDVLYAHGQLRDAQIALTQARRDLYVAQSALLRHAGVLEARSLLARQALYDPQPGFAVSARRAGLPWDGAARAIDALAAPKRLDYDMEQLLAVGWRPKPQTQPRAPVAMPSSSGQTRR